MKTLAEQNHKPLVASAVQPNGAHYNYNNNNHIHQASNGLTTQEDDSISTEPIDTPASKLSNPLSAALNKTAARRPEEDELAKKSDIEFVCEDELSEERSRIKSQKQDATDTTLTSTLHQRRVSEEPLKKPEVELHPPRCLATPAPSSREATPEPQQAASGSMGNNPNRKLGLVKRVAIDCLMSVIKLVINVYDLISAPVHYFKYNVGHKQALIEQPLSHKIDPRDPNSAWRQINIEQRQLDIEKAIDSHETYDSLMKAAFERNASSPCYGYRTLIEERWVKKPGAVAQSNGSKAGEAQKPMPAAKLMRQVRLSEYKWITFGEFNAQIEAAKLGFASEGVEEGDKVLLFADTRPEWQIASQALLRLGAVVVTMYATLGIDGIIHTMNETHVSHVITQRDKVRRLLSLRSKLPHLRKVVYFDSSLDLPEHLGGSSDESANEAWRPNGIVGRDDDDSIRAVCKQVSVESKTFKEVLEFGSKLASQAPKRPKPDTNKDSIAVIMYTSGSTGIPKGVLISHRNIMATLKAFSYVTKDFVHSPKDNVCTAYLPLAHIFEFCIESVMLYHGVRYGFATPHTLTDKSPGLVPGEKGDLTLLRPTVMIIVPLILDRVVEGIKQALAKETYFKQKFVTHLLEYKQYWQKRQYETPLVDKIVCSKMAAALGGRAKYVICGSAPLSGSTQSFIRAALNLKLPQGFGTTETTAATTCQLFDDQSTGNVGVPVAGARIKLEAWPEGSYYPSDEPNPRGEIVVGGDMISMGYYNLEQATKEAFYVDDDGIRWYRTGDIGEFLPNGNLKIIDRKKDLVKLQNGEYISLGRVEATLKSNPYTDNFCVFANSRFNYVVALAPANEQAMRQLAQQILQEHNVDASSSTTSCCSDQSDDDDAAARCADGKVRTRLMTAQKHSRSSSRSQRLPLLQRQNAELADDDCQDQSSEAKALAELSEVVASYELDQANNNNNNATNNNNNNQTAQNQPPPRRDSTLSQSGDAVVNERLRRLCNNELINEKILLRLQEMSRERNLLSLEVPKKLLLLDEEWTEDKNLVTAAMKIRRNFIYKRYEQELARLYE